MKKNILKLMMILAISILCVGFLGVNAFAAEVAPGNIWHGDEVQVPVTKGEGEYTFMSVYRMPYCAYETSGTYIGDGNSIAEGPMTFVVLDTEKLDGQTWTPDDLYACGETNYEVTYCCDIITPLVDGTYYRRINLEDSTYYTDEAAANIRAIVTNSYPFVSLDKMKADLKADGFEYADQITRSEALAAVQGAIWTYANDADLNGVELKYQKSFNVGANPKWGNTIHDIIGEMSPEVQALGARQFVVEEEAGKRIDALMEHLLGYEKVYAEKNQIVISDVQIVDFTPVQEKEGKYTTILKVVLNNSGSSENDNINIDLYSGEEALATIPVEFGKEEYYITVETTAEQPIKTVVSGVQTLPVGVYFYDPVGGRHTSQSLVGAAMGQTNVYAEAEIAIPVEYKEYVPANLSLVKVDENGQPLTGVTFDLFVEGQNETLFVNSFAVDANGALNIEGLLYGNYTLVETATAEGYVLPEEAISFSVDEEGVITLSESEYAAFENGILTVVNEPEEELFEILDEDVPLAPGGNKNEEIEDEPKEEPDGEVKGDYEEVEDPEVPKAENPKTGDVPAPFWTLLISLAVLALAVVRKKELNK